MPRGEPRSTGGQRSKGSKSGGSHTSVTKIAMADMPSWSGMSKVTFVCGGGCGSKTGGYTGAYKGGDPYKGGGVKK